MGEVPIGKNFSLTIKILNFLKIYFSSLKSLSECSLQLTPNGHLVIMNDVLLIHLSNVHLDEKKKNSQN